ncbi:MAG: coniferyl aldehyde dehydrogenase [Deltaproteobacteria bacterium]|nr:coniferyl aldehyde dehydrogenase [Deltaproteobacteria bacterium]
MDVPSTATSPARPALAGVAAGDDKLAGETELNENLARLTAAFRAEPYPTYDQRKEHLGRLERLVLDNKEAIADAVCADFGNRSRHETLLAEVFVTVTAIRYLSAQLRGWMRPQTRHVSLVHRPGRAAVMYQPVGVVGVISPWNYPFQLAVIPLATALAAGNRVLLKPSELTPATSALLARLLHAAFGPDRVGVVLGDSRVGAAVSRLALDHLLFTGSTSVGRQVLLAAAEHLVPVTLELGGKSPVIVDPTFDVARAAGRIAYGKLLNAGQTCIAPDYVIVQTGQEEAFAQAYAGAVAKLYPTLARNPDYTSIINDRHLGRLRGLLTDARERGGDVRMINPANETFDDRRLAPHLVLKATDAMTVMQDEIFGPILPVVSVPDRAAAADYVRDRPRPLALYVFDEDKARVDDLLLRTHAGGVTVNDTMLHLAQDDLPFGGTGPSGMGRYHGFEGFQALSHAKSVYWQSRFNAGWLAAPPFGRAVERLMTVLLGR